MLSLVIQALKRSVMFLCTPFANRCLIHSDWAFEITWHAHQPDGIHPAQIHLITAVSVIKRLRLYKFTLWGRDLVSAVLSERVRIIKVFLKRKYENFVGHRKLSDCTHFRGSLISRFSRL